MPGSWEFYVKMFLLVSCLLNFTSSLCERRSFNFKALDSRVDRKKLKSRGDKEALQRRTSYLVRLLEITTNGNNRKLLKTVKFPSS